MYATASDVATNLGRSLTQAEEAQAAQWVGWAESTIQRRLGDLGSLDPDTLNMVIVEAVSRRLRMPEPVTQVSVSVDDANVNKTYQKATGLIDILPEWWAALGWVESGAFSVTPYGAPDASPDAWR
ncbi:MAG TPA: hypothetical protein GXZ60_11300 [Intrasporangiaceae bacterium]|nr:hypothetical protein [Intrasporangiaceae bacterium]